MNLPFYFLCLRGLVLYQHNYSDPRICCWAVNCHFSDLLSNLCPAPGWSGFSILPITTNHRLTQPCLSLDWTQCVAAPLIFLHTNLRMSVGASRRVWPKRPTSFHLLFSCHPSPHLLSLVLRILYFILLFFALWKGERGELGQKWNNTTPPLQTWPVSLFTFCLPFHVTNSLLYFYDAYYPSTLSIPATPFCLSIAFWCFVDLLFCLFSSIACSSPCTFIRCKPENKRQPERCGFCDLLKKNRALGWGTNL